MSYDTTGRKKVKTTETQSLLPDTLRAENVKIEGELTKFQNGLRQLIQMKNEIGGDTDQVGSQLRGDIKNKQEAMKEQAKELDRVITDYGAISVPYRSQRQQQEKQEAYKRRLAEISNKFKQEMQEIQIKLQQHLDLARRRQSTMYNGESGMGGLNHDDSQQQLVHESIDLEELKIQGEAAYMDDVIKQRQEDLDNVEGFMTEINSIVKDINTKVHDQRADVIEIDTNASTALDNAKEAEKNIEEAQDHQKSGGRCMYWVIAVISIAVLVIILIIVLSLI